MRVVVGPDADGSAVMERPDSDDLAREARTGGASATAGCNHLDNRLSVGIELEELESVVRHRGVEQFEPATDSVMTVVLACPRKQIGRPERLPLHVFIQQREKRVLLQTAALGRVVKLSHRLADRRGHPTIITARGGLDVVPEQVGSSGSPWRLRAAKRLSPKEDPDEASR